MNMLRACALSFAAFVCQAGTAVAADTLTVRLQFRSQGALAPIVVAERAERSAGALIPLPLDEVETARSWWLLGFDARGRTVLRTPVRNQAWRRLEAFDPVTGHVTDVQEGQVPQGAFEVSFPDDPRIARIALRTGDARGNAGGSAGGSAGAASATLLELGRDHVDRLLRTSAAKVTAKAASTTTLVDSGAAADRLDLVFVGDGYTAAEMGKWQTDAQTVVNGLMSDPLFNVYRRRINIRRVDVASAESGVDEPDLGIYRDTALDSAFNCANIDRLLCANNAKVQSIVGAVLQADARDVVIVVANSTRYGGSGGSIAAISMHAAAVELALHELGHTLFGLADEYDYGTCSLASEPPDGNASLVASRAVKWGAMISRFTTVPTIAGQYPNGTVGVFEGAQYCKTGKYRPTEDSKMRNLGRPWHAVNEQVAYERFALYARNGAKPRIRLPEQAGPAEDASPASSGGPSQRPPLRGRTLPRP